MIRVLHIIGNLRLGGGQKITYAVVRGLAEPDFETSVCCLEEGGHYAELLKAEGKRVFELGGEKNYGFLGLLRSSKLLFELVALIRKERPNIVHTHLFGAGLLGRVAAKIAGVPIVVTTLHRIFYPVIQPAVEKLLSPLTDCVVVDSKAVGGLIEKRCHINQRKIQVIYNGVDTGELSIALEIDEARRLMALPSSVCDTATKIIGVVAHLLPHKGQRYILEALPKVHALGVPAHLLLVGDGPDSAELKIFAQKLGLTDFVHFAGYRGDLNTILSAVDLLALPSSWEGFGLILAEAMYKRIPVISTDFGGSREVVSQYENGFLTPFGNVDQLAHAAHIILSSQNLALQMGNAGKRRVEDMFTMATMMNSYAHTYRRLCQLRN